MIGLDTNVLVRLLTRDDEKQAEKARALLEEHAAEDDQLFVPDVVLAELVWTLDRAYGLDKGAIASAIKALADNATLGFESREVLRHAQELFENSKAGFADCLIVAKAQANGCTQFATFDKVLRSLPGTLPL
ncbi:MAG TPA: type II toxin-antitoxin system VapC family toxin [Solimonas sp.]|nr:type II toxin-antitoxin system VapC family toxin [Solimonas sp.]